MNIREFSQDLQNIYQEMGKHFSEHQNKSGLHCLEACGKCCSNPDIEASVLEMLPMALHLYDQGKLEEWLERLENPSQDFCLMYQSHSPDHSKGQCLAYLYRPSVCRMFGVAGSYNKHQQVTLSICRLIQEKYPDLTKERLAQVSVSETPIMRNWSFLLWDLNPELVQNHMPINLALKAACEKVALYALYQEAQ